MTTTAVHEDLGTRIADALDSRVTARAASADAYGPEFGALWRTASDQLRGGKLLRPRLLLEVWRGLAPATTDDAAALGVAADVELLHFSFLLHDDVIDGDLVRRHRPNLIGTIARERPGERGLHWARASAILMGDLMLSAATLGVARADVAEPVRRRLLDILDETIVETVAGEHADVGLGDGVIRPQLSTVLAMTARKTAAYSFVLPLRAAAVLAGAPADIEDGLAAIGRRLGLAYQLQDDLLSVFGDPGRHGKDPLSDLREGKETAIVSSARGTAAWARIAPSFGSPALTAKDADSLRRHLRDCGAELFVRTLVDDELAAARREITAPAVPFPEEVRRTVLDLASRIEGRTS